MNNYKFISKNQALKLITDSLDKMRKNLGSNSLLLLSYDLKNKKFLGRFRVDTEGGIKIINECKTFILSIDDNQYCAVSTLTMYTAFQEDISHITSEGRKHDIIIFKWIYLEMAKNNNNK